MLNFKATVVGQSMIVHTLDKNLPSLAAAETVT